MENPGQSPFTPQYQQPLPNSSAVLALGIISIPGCFCYGIVGIVCSIIALVLYNKDKQLYIANPMTYTSNSYSNLRTGRICAIIGLVPSAIAIVSGIILLLVFGFGALMNPQEYINSMQNSGY